jgi:pyruvate/2-oxoglutarate dehydrogenase complex dihydrolipoamide acyltransferase (E2) component
VIEFRLVDIGEGLTQAEIVRWLVAVGDRVSEDEPVVEIETDKAVVEMPAPATGTVVALGGDVGDVVAVGEILVVIDDGSEGAGQPAGVGAVEPETTARAPSAPQPAASSPSPAGGPPATRPLATPSTRGLARRLGVDLGTLRGSGPGGRITDDDVTTAADPPAGHADEEPVERPAPTVARGSESQAAPAAGTRLPLRGIRRRTAETMTAAWQSVPHVDSFHEIDVTDLFSLREQFNAAATGGPSVTMTACFVKATALALAEHPMLNASIDMTAGEIVLHADRHIGVAVDTPDGLVLPVVRHADQRTLPDIAAELARLGEAATTRRLTPAQMSGATFTVSNHGVFGGWFGTSLVHGHEVGIAGFGPARRRPEFDAEGRVVPRRVLVLNLAADHRVVDGRDIINFGLAIRRRLEAPLALFLGSA